MKLLRSRRTPTSFSHASSAGAPIPFHHTRAVTTTTDTIPTPCENHSQIVATKHVPACRGGRTLFDIFRFPSQGLTKKPLQKGKSNTRNRSKTRNPLFRNILTISPQDSKTESKNSR